MKRNYVSPSATMMTVEMQALADAWSLPAEEVDDVTGGSRYRNHLWDDDEEDAPAGWKGLGTW